MKANAKIVVMMIAAVLPSIGFAGDLFPLNPIPMTEGYGKDGAGLHFAIPEGVPGPDCAVNPVSPTWLLGTETVTKDVVVEKFVPGDVIDLPADVLFDFDKSTLREEGKALLLVAYAVVDKVMVDGQRYEGKFTMQIVGNTDSMGTEEYNMALGQRRADAVMAYLKELDAPHGVVEFVATSAGESNPVAPNAFPDGRDDPQGRQLNRRVSLIVGVPNSTISTTEQVAELVEVVKPRNPQVFHVLSYGNRVTCGAEVGTTLGSPQLFFWGWNNGRL